MIHMKLQLKSIIILSILSSYGNYATIRNLLSN